MINLSSISLKPNDSLDMVIQTLQKGGLRIVIIVDDKLRLLGTITDGDVRRALINRLDLSSEASIVMNGKPVVANLGESKELILTKMRENDIFHMPIIDSEGIIKDLETIHHILDKPKIDNPVLIMAGGYGKRLMPLTKDTPKPMLKIGNKPILESIIERFIKFGFHNFILSTHYKSETIKDYFENGSDRGVKISYIDEKEPLGTGGALSILPKDIPDLPLVVMNGDLITEVDFESLLDNHNQSGSLATICVVEYDFQVPYGVIEKEGTKVKNIVEKPIHKFFVNGGIYVVNNELIKQFKEPVCIDMPDFLKQSLDTEEGVNIFPLHEQWIDIGQISEYNRVNKLKT